MLPIRNISYFLPMCCSFWEKCKNSPKTGLGCSTPLIYVKVGDLTYLKVRFNYFYLLPPPLIALWYHFDASYFKLHNDASLASACVRTILKSQKHPTKCKYTWLPRSTCSRFILHVLFYASTNMVNQALNSELFLWCIKVHIGPAFSHDLSRLQEEQQTSGYCLTNWLA